MEEKLKQLTNSFCKGIIQPSCDIINIFDRRRLISLSHYIYVNNIDIYEEDLIDDLKQNEHFNLNDDDIMILARGLVSKINEIREIYRVTVELEGLHI
ncbi:MAG: hypothetical protein IJZ87_08515 [Bacteroidales bacterium]|nr:hypothetical protein [Bacteroidales bacterium]